VLLALSSVAGRAGQALAGVEQWQVNEVHRSTNGDTALAFVELLNLDGGCLFPTSSVDLYDGAANLIDTMSLTVSTACHGAPTYLLLATQEAASYFAVSRDANLSTELPSAGQLCFSSSSTHYDCVRWGQVSVPVVDLFGPSDSSVVPSPDDNFSLARVGTTHVVFDDWEQADPTPRQPNDGSSWNPPDAGPPPDAAPTFDAGSALDAGPRADAAPRSDARADAGSTLYLDLDTVGGGACACEAGGRDGLASQGPVLIVLFILMLRRPVVRWRLQRNRVANLFDTRS
jgi:hypothetical protein